MNQNDVDVLLLDRDAVDRVLDIVSRATSAPLVTSDQAQRASGRLAQWNRRYRWRMFGFALAAFLILPVVALLKERLDRELTLSIALVSAGLAMSSALVPAILDILTDIPWLSRSFKQPYSTVMQAVRASAHLDLQFLEELRACDRNVVQYVLRHYQYRRIALEKRAPLLSGNIDKIGLFPAIAGVALLWGTLSGSPYGHWFSMLPPLIFVFHLLSLWSYEHQERMDRIIGIMELRLSLQQEK